MKFSLILATIHRTGEVRYFLESLNSQTYRNFELIVVDQNTDDRILELIHPYQDQFPILHLRSAKGLSRARNAALSHISGNIVAFPDDDCAYPSSLLENVAQLFSNHPEWGGLTGRPINQEGQNSVSSWAKQAGAINQFNVWQRGISYTIFLRRNIVEAIGEFDETLGVGADTPWGSAEETDYLLRAIDKGLYYDPNLTVVHPVRVGSAPVAQALAKPNSGVSKTYLYAMGRGRVLRKHNAPLWFVCYNWGRPLVGAAVSLLKGQSNRVRSHWATFQGRFQGWLGWA